MINIFEGDTLSIIIIVVLSLVAGFSAYRSGVVFDIKTSAYVLALGLVGLIYYQGLPIWWFIPVAAIAIILVFVERRGEPIE